MLIISNRYFEGGVSSVYLWDLEDGGFAGVVLLKKSMSLSLGRLTRLIVFQISDA